MPVQRLCPWTAEESLSELTLNFDWDSTANMIFTVDHIVWYLSQFMVLRPGDLINTGTPSGVALGEPDEPFLRAGDVMELKIDHLGTSRQELIAS